MNLELIRIIETADLEAAWAIRKEVFVVEQNCPEDIEWEFEEESIHYLASLNGKAVGTARWRQTENGIKLERFAVLMEARNKGVASALVQKLLDETNDQNLKRYLHAQLQAAPLYAKFGFKPHGPNFWEADIEHVKMVKE
ncbi:MAG: GNAT family N-acetyltransferase [Bacteroidetes bacterium B1(2017)]|nr:MAG: GNAT family N-acetyltransferase [Bacteroidetes bacterium B1(2017)]